MNDQIAEYIRENRGRYTRQAIDDQLKAAGHDAESIAEAWAAVGPPERGEPALPGVRYGPVVIGLLILGGAVSAIAGRDAYFGVGFWIASYVISALIVMAIGIGMTNVAAGSGWKALVVLVGLLWAAMMFVTNEVFIGTGIAAVVTLTAFAVHRYHKEVPLLAYALPVLGWLAITGVCVSPLLTGT
jgi:hypothetical protein